MLNNGPVMPPYGMMNMNDPIDSQQMPTKSFPKTLVFRTDMLNQLSMAQQRNEVDSVENWHASFIATHGSTVPKPSRKRTKSMASPPMYPNPGMPGSNGVPQNGGMTPTNGMPPNVPMQPDFNQMQQPNNGMNEFYQPMSNSGMTPSMPMMEQHDQANMGGMPMHIQQQAMQMNAYGRKMDMKKDEDDHPLRRIERMTEQTLDQSPKINQRCNDKKQNEDRQQKMAKLDDIATALNLPNGAPMMPMPGMRPPYIPQMPPGYDPSHMMRPPNMMMPNNMDPNMMPPQMYNGGMPPASMPQPSPNFPMMVNSPAHSQNAMMPGQFNNMQGGMSPKFPPMMPQAMMSPGMRPMMPPYNGAGPPPPDMMAGMRPPMNPMAPQMNPVEMQMWRNHQMMMMQNAQMSQPQ